jgi:CRISPR-associated protein Cas1
VPVLFFVKSGKAYGALVASGLPNPLRLRAQYDLLMSMGRRTALARSVVEAKIGAMLRRLSNVPEAAEARGELSRIREGLGAAGTPEVLRGHEGAATKSYYRAFATRIRKPGFAFTVRSRRPPRDAVNSLLSFAYALLFAEMQTALLAHGLDPSPALLHDLHRNHLALASDLIEPYRVLIADSFVLWLVNTGQVEAEGFEPRGGGVYMKRETLLAVIAAYEQYMMRRGGGGKGAAPPRWLVDEAARSMLAVVLGERERLELPLVPAGMGEEEGP